MLLTMHKEKYDIDFSKNINETEYSIVVYFDNKVIEVRGNQLLSGEYKLEIKKVIYYDDWMDITVRKLYGKKFKKNFDIMKKLINKLFKELGDEY